VRRLNVGLVASVCLLALAFALIRPTWLAAAGPVPTSKDDRPSGVSVSFGSKGPAVDVQVLTHGRIAEVVHAPATIKSGSEVAVAAPFDGRVRELCVDEGDAVIASQVIFRLDPIEYDDKLHEAELELDRKRAARIEADAELKEAEHRWEEAKKEPSTLTEARLKVGQSELNNKLSSSELENADAKLKRATKMLEDHVGTQQDVDVAISDKKSAEFKLQISNGELDLACRRSFPTPEVALYRLTGLSRLFPRSPRFGRYNLAYLPVDAIVEVDSVVGACMLVRSEILLTVGLLDEAFFMYGEDLDWALRIKQFGWKIVYNGQVVVHHHKRASSSQRSVESLIAFYQAMLIFFEKHYAPRTILPLRWLVIGGIYLRAGLALTLNQLRTRRMVRSQAVH